MRSPLTFVVFLSLMAFAGCGNTTAPSPTARSEQQVISDRLSQIAKDRFATDEQVLHAYLAEYPYKPTAYLKDGVPWAFFRKSEAGFTLVINRLDPVCVNRAASQKQDPLSLEREGIKAAAELCQKFLSDLAPRGLTAIHYTLVDTAGNDPSGSELYVDRFRVIVTPENIDALSAVQEQPLPGSAFDPRASKLTNLWTVQKNRYPRISYGTLAVAESPRLDVAQTK